MTARRKVVRLCENKRICCLDALHAALFARQSAPIARLACAPEADAKGPAPRAKQVVLAGEIQLPHAWTAVSDQTGAYFVEMACLALAECRLKGFKQHVHWSATPTQRPTVRRSAGRWVT